MRTKSLIVLIFSFCLFGWQQKAFSQIPQSDLVVSYFESFYVQSGRAYFQFVVSNQGAYCTGFSNLVYFKNQSTGVRYYVGSYSISGLPYGEDYNIIDDFSLSTLPSGTYSLVVYVDSGNAISESDEYNTFESGITIQK